jgi:hypothetical protein
VGKWSPGFGKADSEGFGKVAQNRCFVSTGNESIASVTNTAETITIIPEADARLATTSPITDASGIPSIKSISLDYFLLLVNRLYKRTADENSFIPGFTAVRTSLTNLNFHETTKILTPILPYPATTYTMQYSPLR